MSTATASSALASRLDVKRRPIIMPAIIALVLIGVIALAVVAVLAVLGFAVHLLFSPWLLLAAVAILVWIKFRPHRSR